MWLEKRAHYNLENICLINMLVVMLDIEQAFIFMKLFFLSNAVRALFSYICVNK